MNTNKIKLANIFGNGGMPAPSGLGRVDVSWNGSTRTDTRYYYLKDHLGSTRVEFDRYANVSSAYNYYAYGQISSSYNNSNPNDKYKFTGKESVYVRQSGTSPDRRDKQIMIIFPNGMAMPGARYGVYPAESGNSELGRWMQVDPLAAKYPGWSPYNYTLGNPVNLIDPNGMEVLEGGGEEDEDEEEVEYKKAKDELFARLWEHITHEAQNAFQNLSNTLNIETEVVNKEAITDVYNTVYGEGPGFLNGVSDGIAYGGLFVGGVSTSIGAGEFGVPVIIGSYALSTKIDVISTTLTFMDYLFNGGNNRLNKLESQGVRLATGAAFGDAIVNVTKTVKTFYPIIKYYVIF